MYELMNISVHSNNGRDRLCCAPRDLVSPDFFSGCRLPLRHCPPPRPLVPVGSPHHRLPPLVCPPPLAPSFYHGWSCRRRRSPTPLTQCRHHCRNDAPTTALHHPLLCHTPPPTPSCHWADLALRQTGPRGEKVTRSARLGSTPSIPYPRLSFRFFSTRR
jgi:hypothetical protein